MGFVSTEEFQREGRAVDSEMVALDEAVDRVVMQRQRGASMPFPDGPWWQRWKGFRGSWSQYFEEQVKPTPMLPVHDDGDIQQWSKDLDAWKAEFAKGQVTNATQELGGPKTATLPGSSSDGSSSMPSALKAVGAIAALGAVGYLLSSAGNLKRAFG